jgi:hypothetical protein
MRQSDMKRILQSDTAVPDEKIFGASTTSTPHVQLSRLKKEFEREGNTIVRLQCYRQPLCELPEELKRAPVLFGFATVLNGSTAQSIDQLAARVWGSNGASNDDVTTAVDRLRDVYGLNIVSTGYHAVRVET